MKITEEILDRAKTIVLQQKGTRVDLENELGLKENSAKELYIKVKADELIAADPGLPEQVRALIEHGESKFAIARTLNLSLAMTDHMLKLGKTLINDEEIHIEDDEVRIGKKRLRD